VDVFVGNWFPIVLPLWLFAPTNVETAERMSVYNVTLAFAQHA